ncbi:MAG: hypothetical protein WC421_06335 [Elusimicrobiales bacterium]
MKEEIIAAMLCGLPLAVAVANEPTIHTFPSQGITSLKMDVEVGAISVDGTAGDKITVEDLPDNAAACDITMAVKGDKLVITERKKSNSHNDWTYKTGFKVNISSTMLVSITAESANMVVSAINGGVDIKAEHGNISLSGVKSTVKLENDSGVINVKELVGDLTVKSDHSNIDISDLKSTVKLENSSGVINVKKLEGDLTVISDHSNIDISGAKSNIKLENGSGVIHVADLTGNLTVKADHNNIDISDLKSTVKLENDSGVINVKELAGDLTVKSDHCSITAEALKSNQISIDAESGSVRLKGLHNAVYIKSGSGAVNLQWDAAPASGKVEIESGNGDVELHFPKTAKLSSQLSASGKIVNEFEADAAGIPVIVKTETGRISVVKN